MEEEKKQAIGIQHITLALVFVAVLFIAYIASRPVGPSPEPTPTPEPTVPGPPSQGCDKTPTNDLSAAKDYVARVMASYSDMIYAEVPTPTFDPCRGQWLAQLTIRRGPASQGVMLVINDSPMTLEQALLEGPKPPFISQNKVVTNGTLLLFGKTSCATDRPAVWEFSDPYCPNCILAEEKLYQFKEKFQDRLNFTYRVVFSTSEAMKNSFGKDDVERFSKYILCAQRQGLRDPLLSCATAEYRHRAVEAPLPESALDACLPPSANRTEFDQCLAVASLDLDFDLRLAQTYGIEGTPGMLIDCQYRVHPTYLEHALCFVHPELLGC